MNDKVIGKKESFYIGMIAELFEKKPNQCQYWKL